MGSELGLAHPKVRQLRRASKKIARKVAPRLPGSTTPGALPALPQQPQQHPAPSQHRHNSPCLLGTVRARSALLPSADRDDSVPGAEAGPSMASELPPGPEVGRAWMGVGGCAWPLLAHPSAPPRSPGAAAGAHPSQPHAPPPPPRGRPRPRARTACPASSGTACARGSGWGGRQQPRPQAPSRPAAHPPPAPAVASPCSSVGVPRRLGAQPAPPASRGQAGERPISWSALPAVFSVLGSVSCFLWGAGAEGHELQQGGRQHRARVADQG